MQQYGWSQRALCKWNKSGKERKVIWYHLYMEPKKYKKLVNVTEKKQTHRSRSPLYPDVGKDWGWKENGATEDEMAAGMLSNHLILHYHFIFLSSIFPSIRGFPKESALRIKWPKYWSFSTSSSNEYLGLISFRIDCFALLAVQRTLKILLQHHNSKH